MKAENAKLKGELAMRKRVQHGKGSEKPKETTAFSDEKNKEDEDN